MYINNNIINRRWWLVVVYTLAIFLTLPYVRGFWDLTGSLLGPVREYLVVAGYLGVAGFVLFRRKILFLSLIVVVTVAIYRFIPLPVERIHFIEYGIMGWLAYWAAGRSRKGLLLALAYIIVMGILDEVIQGILPNRYYDTRDIVMNIIGGGLGVFLRYGIYQPNAPFEVQPEIEPF